MVSKVINLGTGEKLTSMETVGEVHLFGKFPFADALDHGQIDFLRLVSG